MKLLQKAAFFFAASVSSNVLAAENPDKLPRQQCFESVRCEYPALEADLAGGFTSADKDVLVVGAG